MNIKYEIWNIHKLEEYIKNNKSEIIQKRRKEAFQGFHYFSPHLIPDIDRFNKEKYSLNNLSALEIQNEFNSNPIFYARFVVAIVNSKIVGIIACQWIKEDEYRLPFWRYHEKYVDIHENFRKLEIAKKLSGILDKSEFLKGHILQRSISSEMGIDFFKKKLDSYLKGKNYALIPANYSRTSPPTESGIYNSYGEKIK